MRAAGKFLNSLLFVAVAVATLLFSLAASAGGRIVVFHAEGEGADAIAKDLKEQLPKGLSAGDVDSFHSALGKQGHKGGMGKALDGPKSREKLLDQVRKAAEAAGVDAVVIVRVKKVKKDRVATVLVVDPKSAALAREDEVTLPPKKGKDDSKPVAASVMPVLEKFAPAAEPAPTKEVPKPEAEGEKKQPSEESKPEEPSARVAGDFGQAMVVVSAAVEGGFRKFEYNQPITKNLRGYGVSWAPGFAADLQLYPLASIGGALAGIGLEGGYAQAVALQSAPASGQKIDTTWNRWNVGLRYRIRVCECGAYVAPHVGYGAESFTFSDPPNTIAKEVPAAKYTFVKAGLDGRYPLGPVAIMLGASWLFASSGGDDLETIGSRFPHHTIGGVDGNVAVGVGIAKGLEARLGYRYTRFFYTMNPEPGETYIAGGALDQLSSLHLGAAYAY